MTHTLLTGKYEYRRRLPHYQKDDRAVFVTFCCGCLDLLPEAVRDLVLRHSLYDQGIKSASAHSLNRALERSGPVWQEESFDHVLRSEESFLEKLDYIRQNPVRRGLVSVAEDYRWSWGSKSKAEAAGEGARSTHTKARKRATVISQRGLYSCVQQ